MSKQRLLILAVLIPFIAFSTWVTWVEGYVGFFTLPWTHWIWAQELLDLCLALTLVSVWLVGDARRRGATWWPYLLLTPLLGSIAPLMYLALRPDAPKDEPPV